MIMWICLLSLLLATVLWYRIDFIKAFAQLREHITIMLALEIIFFTVLHFGNEPLRWWVIMRKRQDAPSLISLYHTASATALISYIFPARLGLPTRLIMAKNILDLDYIIASAVLIIDSCLLYGTWFLVGTAGGGLFMPEWNVKKPVILVIVIMVIVALLFVLVRLSQKDSHRFPWLSKYIGRFISVLNKVSVYVIVINVTLLLIDIYIYGVRHFLILSALGVECSLLKVISMVAISVFAGFISLMPLGLGGYDLSLALLLTIVGVPREAAIATPLINRISMISVGLVLGSISYSRLGITWDSLRKIKVNNTKDLP